MTTTFVAPRLAVRVALVVLILANSRLSVAKDDSHVSRTDSVGSATETVESRLHRLQIKPLLDQYCQRCHNEQTMKSGVRVDHLDGSFQDRHLFLWNDILKQVTDGAMPPKDERQPDQAERKTLAESIRQAMNLAKSRNNQKNGSIRRLTVSQYRNTLRELLGLEEDLTEILPPDGISKDGFANNGQVMVLSPLQMEYYFEIAEKSLNLCIVDPADKPVIQTFRVDLGEAINPAPCPDKLILGADNLLLRNQDFLVTELAPSKPFDYLPFAMRTAYDFIEGYAGNDTVRGWRKFDSIYHSVFACMRGTGGYPKGEPYRAVPGGLLLRPAIPSSEIFGQSSTYGPMANFKISLRELPGHGNFRVTVKAARYNDALLLNSDAVIQSELASSVSKAADLSNSNEATVAIDAAGIYQVDVHYLMTEKQDLLTIHAGDRLFARLLTNLIPAAADSKADKPEQPVQKAAFMLLRLPIGELKLKVSHAPSTRVPRVALTRLSDDSELAKRFAVFEKRAPLLGVHLGLRRDCGSTLAQVGEPQPVSSTELNAFVFDGAINDYPSPDVEKDNVNYLAGIREIGVRSEFTDGRDLPQLMIHSVEFEGPFYTEWPPKTHRQIFIDSAQRNDSNGYARDIIRSFITRAYRRPVTVDEETLVLNVWKRSFAEKGDFQQSIKDALLVVLTSPQFLFLIESSPSPESEDLDPYELASKLSYFLWNSPPDKQLIEAARTGTLHSSLNPQTDRMIRDSKFQQFVTVFTSQWLSLDKFDVVEVDQNRFPLLTRAAKAQLRKEPIEFLRYLIENNLPLRNVIQSEFVLVNDPVARYYDFGEHSENGLRFQPLLHENQVLGGILSQASILAGLSDGRESNPVKRGAWVARRIIAEPPDDPPPNVPELKDEPGVQLSLREKLERHRNQEGCIKCHSGIDPWGVPFEKYDASGKFKKDVDIDARSVLPDGTEVRDLNALKAYLANDRLDQVAFSFLKHLSCYAVGRSLTYNEIEFLRQETIKLRAVDYRLQEMIRFVINSDIFLKK